MEEFKVGEEKFRKNEDIWEWDDSREWTPIANEDVEPLLDEILKLRQLIEVKDSYIHEVRTRLRRG